MPDVDFMHSIEIQIARPKLHSFLCDLENYVPLHPLIESIDELSPTDELPKARRYRVVDQIPVGPFRLRTVYTAALDPVSESEVHGHAWQWPGIQLLTVYSLGEIESGTRIVEHVSVSAPRLMRSFVVRQASQSHLETLGKMKKLLENGINLSGSP